MQRRRSSHFVNRGESLRRLSSQRHFNQENRGARQNRHGSLVVRMTSDYNDNSELQSSGGEQTTRLVRKYTEALLNDSPETNEYVISEFGCATGQNSVLPVATFQGMVKAPVVAVMNDRVENDWSKLFETLNETLLDYDDYDDADEKKEESRSSSLKIEISGHSMYKRSTGRKAHLSYTNYAIQWLSHCPVTFKHDMWANHLPPDDPCHKLWKERSALDLKGFLQCRANDTYPGGYILLGIHGSNEGGAYIMPMYTLMAKAKKELMDANLITIEEATALVGPEYFRPLQMILDIVHEHVSESGEAMWSVEEAETVPIECPFIAAMNTGELSSKECAEKQVDLTKSWADWMIEAALPRHKANLFWERVRRLAVADDTCQAGSQFHYYHYVVLKRRSH